jgi:glycosyltransferase involved in cell wall biosynthesis
MKMPTCESGKALSSESSLETISFVVPVYNEAATLNALFHRIEESMAGLDDYSFDVTFVDDGSTDSSWKQIQGLRDAHPGKVRAIRMRSNFGKATALAVGFSHSSGDLVCTLDADLQDDPGELPKMLQKLNEGFDVVCGWKKIRRDPVSKTVPSRLFNYVTARITGIRIHDFNSGVKLYRRTVLRSVKLYGELHRYIPVLACDLGYKVAEVPVQHHPRQFGRSKYGFERFGRGLIDLVTVLAITRYLKRPGHLFGGIGFGIGIMGGLALTYLTILWFFGVRPIGNRPLFLFGIMASILSVQFVFFGILAELLVHKSDSRFEEERIEEVLSPDSSVTPPQHEISRAENRWSLRD